jgi:hypothetical protein
VAVTGHRALDSATRDGVRRSVGKVIGELVVRCAPAGVELVTGMADGADQIVTEVAIEQGFRITTWGFISPSPPTC